ncbi:hypothetical protein CYMTET_52048 [Cymbomonas tetramitiformis]|uniref:Uncharacterized protein n=1 Tax=Cymbomonas tetramitiformis TaxID=36881 RepID=A0AAE0ER68_9CHLO|nr:hypothetical protein CYMTET_52048 [Cymbomonas tetramitiformis]
MTDLSRFLRASGFKDSVGYTFNNEEAEADFSVLLAGLRHVLFAISYQEVAKLLDLYHDYDAFHVTINDLLTTMSPHVLREDALAFYHETSLTNPGDGSLEDQSKHAVLTRSAPPTPADSPVDPDTPPSGGARPKGPANPRMKAPPRPSAPARASPATVASVTVAPEEAPAVMMMLIAAAFIGGNDDEQWPAFAPHKKYWVPQIQGSGGAA